MIIIIIIIPPPLTCFTLQPSGQPPALDSGRPVFESLLADQLYLPLFFMALFRFLGLYVTIASFHIVSDVYSRIVPNCAPRRRGVPRDISKYSFSFHLCVVFFFQTAAKLLGQIVTKFFGPNCLILLNTKTA